uniref:NADH-ubiquinone oxidoreductase chain 2 n=1 Tax=Spaniocelyphus pilosus TaxID=1979293 RepID=A0A1W5YKE3_9MUSC|nr:NADH dehydrogenase subunit 2 [Spaniocelyphus pilosus]ARI44225.1 NADH dehydrogenase subunit 2 [Spaniocelyphus pilosus]
MFNNSSKIMFSMILITGTMITVSANSWIGAWMGLEINLLSFIPLMSDSNNLMSTEASLKYFLTQALASSVLLFAIILFLMENNLFINLNKNFSGLMILSALLLKSGTAPFHFWFPNVMEGLSWINSLILMTWQKIAPLMLISYIPMKFMMMICIILSSIIGSLGGLNQTSLRKLMAYSSINHLGWMISAMFSSENLWIIYFLFYSFLSMNLIMFFNMWNLFHINQLFSMFTNSMILKFSWFLNLLSLGGLPPFLGFIPKWLVIQMLSINSQMFLMTLLTTMTLITLFFYLRLCFAAFMLSYPEPNWMEFSLFSNKMSVVSLSFTYFSSFGLIWISLIYFMI